MTIEYDKNIHTFVGMVHKSNQNISYEEDSVEKTLYELKEQNFTGVLVGYKDLVVKEVLSFEHYDSVDVGIGYIPEKDYIDNIPIEVEKCAIVYYSNNKKHYVPINKIESIIEREE